MHVRCPAKIRLPGEVRVGSLYDSFLNFHVVPKRERDLHDS